MRMNDGTVIRYRYRITVIRDVFNVVTAEVPSVAAFVVNVERCLHEILIYTVSRHVSCQTEMVCAHPVPEAPPVVLAGC
jgi:hypothetical protein